MAPVILSQAGAAPPEIVSNWESLQLIWIGWDGSVWDLNSRDSGALLYRRGVEGMHFPVISRNRTTSRTVPGNRLRSWRAEAREVFWPIYLWGDDSKQWRDRNNAFLKTIHPDRPGMWKVTGDETRTLRLTGVFDDAFQHDVDPQLRGWVQYPITLEAAQPYWEGTPIKRGPWRAPASISFIDPAGSPPLHISSGAAFGSAKITNPGDVPVWGVWRLRDALENVEIGVGGTIISLPFDLIDGDELVIDTDPRQPTATLNGEDATVELGLQDYAVVPAGSEVDLHVEAVGPGSVEFELTPLYFRAF